MPLDFPIVLSVDQLGKALGAVDPDRFRSAVAALARRGGLAFDGETVALTAEAAERLGLVERGGVWVAVDRVADDPAEWEQRAARKAELASRVERREAGRGKVRAGAKARNRAPAPAPRPRGNAFDLAALRRTLGA